MKTPRFLIPTLLFVGLYACSATEATPLSGASTYRGNGIAFEHPDGWVEAEPFGPEGTAWQVRIDRTLGLGHIEMVAYEWGERLSPEQVEAFAGNFFEFVHNEAQGDVQDGEIGRTDMDGFPALLVRFRSEERGHRKTAVVFGAGSMTFALSCFAVDREGDEACSLAIESFRFED